jgi:hypothetical protein
MKQKIAELINIIFGFRKFLILLVLYTIAIIFRLKGLINGDEMVRLIEPTTIAFIGANGVEHIVGAVKDHYAAKNAPDPTPYEDVVEVPTPSQEASDLAEEEKAKE